MRFLFVIFLLYSLHYVCGISYIPRYLPLRKRNRHSSIQKERCTCMDENGKNFTFIKNVNETHEKMINNCECIMHKKESDWISFSFFIAFIFAIFLLR